MVCLCFPLKVASSDYQIIENNMRIIICKGTNIEVIERTNQFKKLYYFISSHPKEKNPLHTTKLIYNCPYPEIMAAIASVESEYNPKAIGKYREKSIFQILDWDKGDPTNTKVALNEAIRIFEEKKINRTILGAIKAYNGTGKKAERYRKLVLKEIESIMKMKI
jgi:hypothetical protein